MKLKPEKREYENKYAQQLAADYASLIANINDASKKGQELRARLYKMGAYADKFIKLPSGVAHAASMPTSEFLRVSATA